MKFIFWQNIISHLQSSFLRSIASKQEHEVILVVDHELSPERKAMGWSVPDLGNAKVIVSPGESKIEDLINDSDSSAIHIFSGITIAPVVSNAFKIAVAKKVKIGIMAEPYNWLGIGGYIRYLKSIYERIKYDRQIDFILAIGNKGYDLYQKAGYASAKIFEWGYFAEEPSVQKLDLQSGDNFKIAFTGSLIERKGVDLLLHAVAKLSLEHLEVNIIGNGPERSRLQKIIKAKKLVDVKIHDFMSNEEVCKLIGQQDLFVLPSRRDGWGAVVNEALMQGTPVICSNHCGASVLLQEANLSHVFKAYNINELATLIGQHYERGKLTKEERTMVKKWSECITGEEAADYFLEIMNSVAKNQEKRPLPPWRNKKSSKS